MPRFTSWMTSLSGSFPGTSKLLDEPDPLDAMRPRLSPRLAVILVASAGLVPAVGSSSSPPVTSRTLGTRAGGKLPPHRPVHGQSPPHDRAPVHPVPAARQRLPGMAASARRGTLPHRLLTAFVLLGLLPSLLLFIGAITLIESTVDRWFSSPVNSLASAGQQLVDDSLDMVRDHTYRKAQALAWQLRQVSQRRWPALAAQLWKVGDMDGMCVVNPRWKGPVEDARRLSGLERLHPQKGLPAGRGSRVGSI